MATLKLYTTGVIPTPESPDGIYAVRSLMAENVYDTYIVESGQVRMQDKLGHLKEMRIKASRDNRYAYSFSLAEYKKKPESDTVIIHVEVISPGDLVMFIESLYKIYWGDGNMQYHARSHIYERSGNFELTLKLEESSSGIIPSSFMYGRSSELALKKVVLPDNITEISINGLAYCPNLIEINLENIKKIGNFAFRDCTSLKKIELPSIEILDGEVFLASGIEMLNISSSRIAAIPDYCFANCILLKRVFLPQSITHIGAGAFQNCQALEEIHISAVDPPAVEYNSFYLLPGACKICVPAGSVGAYRIAWASCVSIVVDNIISE